jgi:hypothetical protein
MGAKWSADEIEILRRNPAGRSRDVRTKLLKAGFRREEESIRTMRKRLAAQAVEASEYAPGYFTELIRKHDWPPSFESEWVRPKGYHSSLLLSIYARENKERGVGHAGLPLNLPGAAQYTD